MVIPCENHCRYFVYKDDLESFSVARVRQAETYVIKEKQLKGKTMWECLERKTCLDRRFLIEL